jgi:3-oxoacyl-[acyl-carrier protein] reductase
MKHVLITGGAKGIGRAIVEILAGGDYEIVATYNASKSEADELTAKYKNVRFVQVDLTDRKVLNVFIADMGKEQFDVIVNNAGLYVGKTFEKFSEAELFEQVDLNFAAPARLMQGLLPVLKKSKSPLIINISSQAANPMLPGEAMYSAVKSAMSTLSQVLRTELNPKGVRVTTFEPWGVNTYGVSEPSGMVTPKELAEVVRYVIDLPGHLQLDTVGISHIQQFRGDYPEWIEK